MVQFSLALNKRENVQSHYLERIDKGVVNGVPVLSVVKLVAELASEQLGAQKCENENEDHHQNHFLENYEY